jgi:hypothetical protein
VRSGSDHEKSPVCAETSHELAASRGVAAKDPVPDADTGVESAFSIRVRAETWGATTIVEADAFVVSGTAVSITGVAVPTGAVVVEKSEAAGALDCTHRTRDA